MIEDKIKYNDYWERVQEKEQEIERLNKENIELKDTKTKYFNENRLLEKDNVRLNNIITKIRNYIEVDDSWYSKELNICCNEILRIINEGLQGSDKE